MNDPTPYVHSVLERVMHEAGHGFDKVYAVDQHGWENFNPDYDPLPSIVHIEANAVSTESHANTEITSYVYSAQIRSRSLDQIAGIKARLGRLIEELDFIDITGSIGGRSAQLEFHYRILTLNVDANAGYLTLPTDEFTLKYGADTPGDDVRLLYGANTEGDNTNLIYGGRYGT